MDTGSGLLETWHQVVLLVLPRSFLYTHLIMHEPGWPMMLSQRRKVERDSLMVFLMYTRRLLLQMVLLASIEDSTSRVLES